MKLFVWEYKKDYESFLAVAIAEDSEMARTLISRQEGFTSEHLKDFPCEYDLDKEVAFVMSHSG